MPPPPWIRHWRAVCWDFDFEIFGAADTKEILCWSENIDPAETDIFVTGLDKKARPVRLLVRSVIPHRGASGLQVCAAVSIRAWLVDGRGPLPGASGGRSPGARGHGRARVEIRWIRIHGRFKSCVRVWFRVRVQFILPALFSRHGEEWGSGNEKTEIKRSPPSVR